jgi:hypothetical protein
LILTSAGAAVVDMFAILAGLGVLVNEGGVGGLAVDVEGVGIGPKMTGMGSGEAGLRTCRCVLGSTILVAGSSTVERDSSSEALW